MASIKSSFSRLSPRKRLKTYRSGQLSFWQRFERRHLGTIRQRVALVAMVLALLVGVIMPVLMTPRIASAWWNSSWLNRRAITIDNTGSSSTLNDFPIRVSLTSSNITYANTKAAGADIRFVNSDDSTALDYQIETWNSSGTSEIWVRIPSLTATNYTIYMYYNNTAATDAQNATSVWNSNYAGVWHFGETGNGTIGEFKDSTSNANNGRGGNGTSTKVPTLGTGRIGSGQTFDDTDDYIQAPSTASLSITADITLSGWVKRSATTNYSVMMNKGNGSSQNDYDMYICHSNASSECSSPYNNSVGIYSDGTIPGGGNSTGGVASVGQINDTSTWHYLSITRATSTVNFYIDGVLDRSTSMSGSFTSRGLPLMFGADDLALASSYFAGTMDEMRISNIARTADWNKADYLTGNNLMNTFGGELVQAPDAPVLTAVANATSASTTPVFQMKATDQVNPTYLRYKVEVCSTSDCSSVVRTIDQTASQTGWSGQDAQTGTAYVAGTGLVAPAAISQLQSTFFTQNPPTPGVPSISQTFSSSVAANSLITAWSRWGTTPASTLASCSDTKGNTYTIAQQQNDSTNAQGSGSCYAVNTQGAGSNTVTMTYSNSATLYPAMIISEFSNVATSSPLDVKSQNFDSTGSASPTSGSATTTSNGDLIVGHFLEKGTPGTDTAGTGFILRVSTGLSQAYSEDMVQSTAGPVAATMNFGTSNIYSADMMTFKAAIVSSTSTLATHTYQAPALTAGTQYWWRAYAIDPSGSNSWSLASSISTFTTQGPPVAPTLVTPGNGEVASGVNPLFTLRTIDPNAEDVKYKIQVCSVSDCSTVVRTIDQSASQTGWSGQNSGGGTRYTTATVLANSQLAIHTYQNTALAPLTQYWWRAYAIDPTGSNTSSPASSIYSFTTSVADKVRVQGGTKIQGGTRLGN